MPRFAVVTSDRARSRKHQTNRSARRLTAPIEALESRRLLTAIVSGERVTGTVANPGDSLTYTFDAVVGDSLILSLGELANWAPRLEVLAPDNASLGTVTGSTGINDFNRQVTLNSITQSGTYSAVVTGASNTTGDFALSMLRLPSPQPFDDGPIVSGQRTTGTLSRGDLNVYSFTAGAGDSLVFSIGELANWAPQLDVYGPGGTELATVSGSSGINDFNRQVSLANLAQPGTYFAVVRSAAVDGTGEYALALARLPANQPFNSGPIVSGERKIKALGRGDLHVYTFDANVGDSVILSIGELANWAPRLDVYAPDGTLLDNISGSSGVNDFNRQIDLLNLTQSGTYFAVARSAQVDTVGDYALAIAKLPGLQPFDSGPIVSGERKDTVLQRGDLDVYTVSVNIGDSLVFSIGELLNWAPRIDVFDSAGTRLGTISGSSGVNDFNRQVELLNVMQGGIYYIVARSAQADTIGPYALSIARLPGAQLFNSGPITSGQRTIRALDRGDLDVFTFAASAGDSVLFSIGELANWAPQVDIFDPFGARVGTIGGSSGVNDYNRQVDLLTLQETGTYFAVVRSAQADTAGEYALAMAKFGGPQSPDTTDNDGGAITSGQTTSAAIATGDFDVYTLDLALGAGADIQMTRLTGSFNPQIDLFAPSGVRLATHTTAGTTAMVNLASAPDPGTYFIVARTSSVAALGNYSIAVNATPGPDTRPPEVISSEFRWDVARQQIVFMLNESVAGSVQVSDMTLLNLTTNQTVPNTNMSVVFNAPANQIVWEFPGYPFRALPDGDYRATLNIGSVEDAAGNALPTGFSFEFFFLQGDANRDRRVNLADFNILATHFGRNPARFSQADFNYDGQTNLADFNILAARFGNALASPGVTTRPASGSLFASGDGDDEDRFIGDHWGAAADR